MEVAIIGAGFTGLWTAWYLLQQQTDLDITLFDANAVGFGASGRNGGWCMGWAMGIEERLADPKQVAAGLELARAMQDTVDEVGRVCASAGINCDYVKGGTLTLATRAFDEQALRTRLNWLQSLGFEASDYTWLSQQETLGRINAPQAKGALYTPHCAAIHPARLVHGLARALRAAGVRIIEDTAVQSIAPGHIRTTRGDVKAKVVLRATEGYTDSIAGQQRQLLPVYSMMVATEVLPDALLQEIGLKTRETFGDPRRMVIYGQRTADNRIAFGGRAGYFFGSKRIAVMPQTSPEFADVETTLKTLLPALEGVAITHRWGGPLGAHRNFRPCVTFDATTGVGSAGGYVGEGVAASNLAGRILADLVLGNPSPQTRLAWVNDHQRRWEPEPLRWLGARAVQWIGQSADASEWRTGRPSQIRGALFSQLAGKG